MFTNSFLIQNYPHTIFYLIDDLSAQNIILVFLSFTLSTHWYFDCLATPNFLSWWLPYFSTILFHYLKNPCNKITEVSLTLILHSLLVASLNSELIMSKQNLSSFLRKKIGFFWNRCRCDDFENNQKSLSAHVQYCSFDLYSISQSKRKWDNHQIVLHSSGTSPYPFLVKKAHVLEKRLMADFDNLSL